MSKSDLYDALVSAGHEVEGYESDLRVRDTPEVREICRELDWKFTPFVCNRTREQWLDVPFAYSPYWEGKS